MRQYKMILRILLILSIINFALALPIAAQEKRPLRGDVLPDVAITMSAKRGDEIEMQPGMYSERLSGNPESGLAGLKGLLPIDGLQHPPQTGTSELQQVSPELSKSEISDHYMLPSGLSEYPVLTDHMVPPGLSKSPSLVNHALPPDLLRSPILDHYMVPPGLSQSPSLDNHALPPELLRSPILDHYMVPPELSRSQPLDHYTMVSTSSESGPSPSSASQSATSSPMEKLKSKSFLSKAVSKVKLWRRISGPGFVRDAVDAAQRELQGLVDTGATVVRNIGKSLNVPPTLATTGVRPAAEKALMTSHEIGVT